ncbi:MAG: inorganic pyrophosphatase [Ruminococcaceae bacterium]|nr:inorganic pyrophosphatase [Oscillospiraceae bacterium]
MYGHIVSVMVDRPLGSRHPQYPDLIYPLNYGYVAGVTGGDGEAQDAYILGPEEPLESFTGRVIAVVHRRDDVEEKWVVASADARYSREDIARAVSFQERYFDSEILLLEE